VGLPGETVAIREGAVWIDGKKQALPDSCNGLEYLDQIEGWPTALWGSKAKPATLGPDEYFVLGDFSARSKDSRLWEKGAPGHPPYAVPASYVVGVVTHIYWPPNRCCILR
jgi:type IV secretory pathway protease TraF